jgi:hypothetical protein
MATTTKDISYLGKDFGQYRKNLIDFTKQYFPDTHTDFNEASPGMLFIELSSYVGDVLSYYTDNNLKESFLNQATEASNVYDIAKMLGYNAKNVVPAQVILDVYQLVPSIGTGANNQPDLNYALAIREGIRVNQKNGPAKFRTIAPIDFKVNTPSSPVETIKYEVNPATGEITYYLLKKQVKATSGDVRTTSFTFNDALPYDKIVLPDNNVVDVISVTESDGDNWTEVPYLAQDTVFEEVPNLVENNSFLSADDYIAPSLLKLKKISKRFITRLRSDGKTELQFGAGVSSANDEEIIPNPSNVGNGLSSMSTDIDMDIDPSNFLYTRTYGQAPANTTLTVTYTIGNGVSDNVPAGALTEIDYIEYADDVNSTNLGALVNFVKSSVTIENSEPARGGKTIDSLDDIKQSALANFSTQNRLVTKEDYIIRCYAMPSRFGSVAKAYIIPDDQIQQQAKNKIANPLAMNLYVLGFNENKQLTELNTTVKENLKTYLDRYRMLTDAINITDAFIVNIGIEFQITVLPNYNSNEVLLKCISELKDYFNIDKWQINQPIIKSNVSNIIANTKGVQSVIRLDFTNYYDTDKGYSGNIYFPSQATKNGIIYPSLDPCIFEVKFPNNDIKGQVVTY